MTFSCEQKLRSQVLCALGSDDLFRLLADSEVDVVMKMLGLLRNLLSSKSVNHSCLCQLRNVWLKMCSVFIHRSHIYLVNTAICSISLLFPVLGAIAICHLGWLVCLLTSLSLLI